MIRKVHKGVELDIFNMYGIVDIRASTTNRSAQITHDRHVEVWELHLYWDEDGNKMCDNMNRSHLDKESAADAGKDWSALGIRHEYEPMP